MGDPEDTPSETNKNTQNKNYTKSDNNKSNISPGQGTQGERVTTRNNARSNAANTTSTANKEYKGETKAFVAVIASRYETLELKKSFGVFREKLINYTLKEPKNAEDYLMLIQDLVDPKTSFDAKNERKYITSYKEKSVVNKSILAATLRQYIDREARFVSNMNKIYVIIWG